ncbi:MAG: methionyl-tRNA formyltransferase [Verrucomicrobia bacterium]|nr:MAG: methionyl-tRNA formyltransferase [Verrucomicrobiota bacterium]
MNDAASLRLVFVATGDIALPVFRHLLELGPRPLALLTQPDKPVGRHQTLLPPTLKLEALQAGVAVWQPAVIGDVSAELAALAPDVIVVMAYGQILRANILSLARLGIVNLHASLLPRHRGASCIQAAIDAGDAATGVSAMHVIRELDAGDVICAKAIRIDAAETAGSLHERLAVLAPKVLATTLRRLASGTATRTPQDPVLATYAPKLEREHGRIDWSLDAVALERRIRAYDPWPGTFTVLREAGQPKRLKIFPPVDVCHGELPPGEFSTADGHLRVGCAAGTLRLHTVQPEGARRMSAGEYLRGRQHGGAGA